MKKILIAANQNFAPIVLCLCKEKRDRERERERERLCANLPN